MIAILLLITIINGHMTGKTEERFRKMALAMWRNVDVPVNEEKVQALKRGAKPPPSKCGEWTRRDLLACFDVLADTNCDKALSASEIDTARAAHLSYVERFLSWYAISTSDIMKWCDTNKDGKITHQEFLNDYEHCLENDADMCHVNTICIRELKKTVSTCPH
jgi:hypothetical protein